MYVSTLCTSFSSISVVMNIGIKIIVPIYIFLNEYLQRPTSNVWISWYLAQGSVFYLYPFLVHLFKESCEIFQNLSQNIFLVRKKRICLTCRYTEHTEKIRFLDFLHNL